MDFERKTMLKDDILELCELVTMWSWYNYVLVQFIAIQLGLGWLIRRARQ